MLVTVVQIGDVRVLVSHGLVLVRVHVPRARRKSRMDVIVMAVVVPMRVRVPKRRVLVSMPVTLPEHEKHAGGEARQGRELPWLDRLTKPGPRNERAEERGQGEEQLGAHGSQLLGRRYIENDGEPVAHRSDGQGRGRRVELGQSPIQREADGEIDGSGDEAFGHGRLGRRESAHQRGQVVIDSPEEAGAQDEGRRLPPGRLRLRQKDPTEKDETDGDRAPSVERLVEPSRGQNGRRDDFGVHPEGA